MNSLEKTDSNLTLQIIVALIAGVAVGAWIPEVAFLLSFLGKIFMSALKMLIMPLIVVTMIVGISSIGDPQKLGRLGGRTILYYLSTTALAIVVGLVAVNWMKPGVQKAPAALKKSLVKTLQSPTSARWKTLTVDFQQHLVRTSPKNEKLDRKALTIATTAISRLRKESRRYRKNLAGKTAQSRLLGILKAELIFAEVGMRRSLKEANKMRAKSVSGGASLTVRSFLEKQIGKIFENPFKAMARGNVLGVIIFSLLLGLMLVLLGDRGRPALEVARSLNDAMMMLVIWVMKFTPIGVFSLMAYQIARSGLDILWMLSKYMLCVVVALGVHAFVVLPLLLMIGGRVSPLQFFVRVRSALSVAFSTSSSSATLPVSIEVAEKEAKLSPQVSGFVLPLGATINMDGTALYEAVAALFIAQLYGIDLGLGPQFLIFLTAALAAIGAAGIPSAGTVTMVMVFSAVGLPLVGIGLILAVDRILDMCRTTVNVWGDLIGAAILDRYESTD
jgi:solute carrier family 1 (high affinity glutamate transporter) protein 1